MTVHFRRLMLISIKTVLLILLLPLLFPVFPSGSDEAVENQIRTISDKLRCPTCQAQSVKNSDSGLSLNMKSRIRELLKEGRSEEEILDFFEERYGEWILREPPKKGFNLFLWLTPLVLIVVIGFLVIRSLAKRSQKPDEESQVPLTSKEKKQIEKDLNRFQPD